MASSGIVYRSAVRGDLEWPDARAACAILVAIASLDRDHLFDQRIEALERALDARDGERRPRINGHAGREARV